MGTSSEAQAAFVCTNTTWPCTYTHRVQQLGKRDSLNTRRLRRSIVYARRRKSGGSSEIQRAPLVGRSRSAKRGVKSFYNSSTQESLEQYAGHFLGLCRLEFEAQKKEAQRLREEYPLSRLIEEGLALADLYATDGGDFYGEGVVALRISGHAPLPRQHRFAPGDIVVLSRLKKSETDFDEPEAIGVVLERKRDSLNVIIETDGVVSGGGWQLHRGGNSITHERLCAALEDVGVAGRAASSDDVVNVICSSHDDVQVAGARDMLRSSTPKVMVPDDDRTTKNAKGDVEATTGSERIEIESLAKQLPPFANKRTRNHARELIKERFMTLSPSQREAVNQALTRRITLIQGPPGTGKTRTACAVVQAAVSLYGGPVLAVASSNTAADNLLQGLRQSPSSLSNVVRIGRAVTVRESLRKYTVNALVARQRSVVEAAHRLRSALRSGRTGSAFHTNIRAARAAFADAQRRAAEGIIDCANVIVSTCVSCGHTLMDNIRVRTVVVDEATQATEPEVLLAILRGCQHLVLVGDHHQLPPTVVSGDAAKGGLDLSLFSRLWSLGLSPVLLDVQFRMHPQLCAFPSSTFYGGLIISEPAAEDRPPPSSAPWPVKGCPLAFIDVCGGEIRRGNSYANLGEARIVARIVATVLKCDECVRPDQVGVITPYNAQVRAIFESLIAEGVDTLSAVEVSSVDGFQGREKELIVLSATRSNSSQRTGFTADWRRLNVALTRARCGLIVVADKRTLQRDALWRQWFHHAEELEVVVDGAAFAEKFGLAQLRSNDFDEALLPRAGEVD